MSWQQGRETIAYLISRGHLEHISGHAANGQYLITQVHQRLSSASTIADDDPAGAYNLAYDGVRQAATALLIQQGLRPKIEGGHVAIAEAVRAQFGEPFNFFNAMRRRRNKLEYPQTPDETSVEPDAVREAIAYGERTLHAVEQLLPQLGIWQPTA
jgi:hypothetical protein